MAQICNKVENLDETQLEDKAAMAKAATAAILGAMSDCYKAAECLHANHTVGPQRVYLHSASAKLDGAITALMRNRDILGSAEPQIEMLEWLQNLDYDRLYGEGVRGKLISASSTQWSRLVDINRTRGYLGVADQLIDGVKELRRAVDVLAESLQESTGISTNEAPASLSALLAAISDFAVFAQMVAYVNRLTPLDPVWTKEALSVASLRG